MWWQEMFSQSQVQDVKVKSVSRHKVWASDTLFNNKLDLIGDEN